MLNIPQELTAWKVSETATKSKLEADNAKQCYLEIACKIRQSALHFRRPPGRTLFPYTTLFRSYRITIIAYFHHRRTKFRKMEFIQIWVCLLYTSIIGLQLAFGGCFGNFPSSQLLWYIQHRSCLLYTSRCVEETAGKPADHLYFKFFPGKLLFRP